MHLYVNDKKFYELYNFRVIATWLFGHENKLSETDYQDLIL